MGLTTHISDVVNQILFEDLEDLEDLVLLGFSYGGCVVTGAVDHVASRIRHLVYLDAFVPEDGESVFSLTGTPRAPMNLNDPWLIPPAARDFDDPAEAVFMNARRTPHPLGCFTEAVRLIDALEDHAFTRTYIRATADRADALGASAFDAAAKRAQESPDWSYHGIQTNHMIASNRPEELSGLLRELT